MVLVTPTIIAPDTSHWSKWIDATISGNPARRSRALEFHARLLEQGRIPLLSWHHLEELLGIGDEQRARARVAFLQSLPLIAWMRLPHESTGLGSIVDILAAEAVAASEGHGDLIAIRDRARQLLLRTGPGFEAIGTDGWVWEVVRPQLLARRPLTDMVAALSPRRTFDESRTIGEISQGKVNSLAEMRAQLPVIHAKTLKEALDSGHDAQEAKAMADASVAPVIDMLPPPGTSVRELLVSTLVDRGLDVDEIRDDSVLADLTELATFRSQLRIVASKTGRSFDDLKRIPIAELPSRLIGNSLKKHGQPRQKRPGGDLIDGYLGVLAAYSGMLYVDKRTAEDFRRAIAKETKLTGLIGVVAKAADFTDIECATK